MTDPETDQGSPRSPSASVPPREPAKEKDRWDKAEIIVKMIGIILVPLVLGLAGFFVNRSVQEKEAGDRLVDSSIKILATAPDEGNPNIVLREWAIDIVNKNSNVPFSDEAQRELRKRPLIPRSEKSCAIACPAGTYSCCRFLFGQTVDCVCFPDGRDEVCASGGPSSRSCSISTAGEEDLSPFPGSVVSP